VKCSKCTHENPSGLSHCQKCQSPLALSSDNEATRLGGDAQTDFEFRRGQVVNGRFTVLDLIGRGGMGRIYKAHDNVLGEDVALKTLLPQFLRDKMVVERFFNEARIARKLAHPNIVRVHDIGSAGKGMYISMEYVQGDSLRGMIEKLPPGKRIPLGEVLRIVDELCGALEYAHQYTIHRDIKPENIMLDSGRRVKLMDFGISKLMDNTRMTGASVVMGTPYYMSPEQLRNSHEVDQRADIYSIGVVLYEVLTGNMPTGVPRPASQMLKEIPPAMDEIVARCVDPDPEKRYQNAAELRGALKPIMQIVASGKNVDKTLARHRKMRNAKPVPWRRMAGVAIVAALVAGMIAGSTAAYRRWQATATVLPAAAGAAGDRFAELEQLVNSVRPRVEPLARGSQDMRAMFESADARWGEAVAARQDGGGVAVAAAEEALQRFLAMALVREGMTFVPPGPVMMDGAQQAVSAFLIDTTEVSIGQYAEFCRSVEGGWRIPEELRAAMDAYTEYPVAWVSWFDAQAYALFRGKALPSRAQWARAGYGGNNASDQYPWGAEWQGNACNCQGQAAVAEKSFDRDRTWSGCFDMAGNVSEWTASCPVAEAANRAPDFGDGIEVCGGSFTTGASPLSSVRNLPYETRAADLGFRCIIAIGTTPTDVQAALARLR
jgi:tRNA A-37 threonylcarbamoyl transferase component Bud32